MKEKCNDRVTSPYGWRYTCGILYTMLYAMPMVYLPAKKKQIRNKGQ